MCSPQGAKAIEASLLVEVATVQRDVHHRKGGAAEGAGAEGAVAEGVAGQAEVPEPLVTAVAAAEEAPLAASTGPPVAGAATVEGVVRLEIAVDL